MPTALRLQCLPGGAARLPRSAGAMIDYRCRSLQAHNMTCARRRSATRSAASTPPLAATPCSASMRSRGRTCRRACPACSGALPPRHSHAWALPCLTQVESLRPACALVGRSSEPGRRWSHTCAHRRCPAVRQPSAPLLPCVPRQRHALRRPAQRAAFARSPAPHRLTRRTLLRKALALCAYPESTPRRWRGCWGTGRARWRRMRRPPAPAAAAAAWPAWGRRGCTWSGAYSAA